MKTRLQNYYFLILCSLLSSCMTPNKISSYEAYVAVPVADLAGEPLPHQKHYTKIPFSGGPKDYTTCPRMHQVLYHERVRIIETRGDQVRIALPNVFYITQANTTPESRFWTLKKYLVPMNTIKHAAEQLPLPQPYPSWATHHLANNTTVTLMQPYYDHVHNITFSAGTRFVRATPPLLSKKKIAVYVLDPKTHQITTIKLPTKVCSTPNQKTPHEHIMLFISLIRSWIRHAPSSSYIPYVWGGASIVNYTQGKPRLHRGKNSRSWYGIEENTEIIKTGCDCSGLIFRAAQIAGIPYFFKNSYTATRYLEHLTPTTPIAIGDIIWIPGHVMIVADIKKNTLFEERSYEHGYGKLHEIPLAKVFKGIRTYDNLSDALHTHQPLYRLDNAGIVQDTFKEFKILRLISAWDIKY